MPTVREDFEWQRKFEPHYEEIIRKLFPIRRGTWDEDARENTDWLVYRLPKALRGKDLRVMCRARRNHLRPRFGGQFTVRFSRPSGVPTEFAKIRAGFGDLGIYGFESEPESGRLRPWTLFNVKLLREYLDANGRWIQRGNPDGTYFAAFDLGEMPLGFVLYHEGYPLVGSPGEPCGICGGPSWTADADGRPVHNCCAAARHWPCLACRTADMMCHFRYGWNARKLPLPARRPLAGQ